MKWRQLWSTRENQRGFTLIEVIAVVAVTGLISVGATMATVQVLNQSTRNNDYTTASRQAMNAIYWISRDAQMAQNPEGASGFPLILSWTWWDNSNREVIYSIEGDELRRSYFVGTEKQSETVVAQYINGEPGNTNFEVEVATDNVVIARAKITATVGNGLHAVSVTKECEIIPRPGL